MNQVRSIQALNARELEAGISSEASWHRDFADTAYVYVGGLPFELSEGDIITMFSQFGEPTHVHLVRDKETGKSKGFAFLKYEDQRSTDLAVDNLGGAQVMGRTLRVDHTRYKKKEGQNEDEGKIEKFVVTRSEDEASEDEDERPMLKEEIELAKIINNHEDDEDPMKAFRVEQKREEVEAALKKLKTKDDSRKHHQHKHRHRSKRERSADPKDDSNHRQRRIKPERSPGSDRGRQRGHPRRSKRDEVTESDEERDRRQRRRPRRSWSANSADSGHRRHRKDESGSDLREDERDRRRRRHRSRERR